MADKFGIYKKVAIPMEESKMELLKTFSSKEEAEAQLKKYKPENEYTKYYIANVEE